MNLEKMLEMQKVLDERIIKEKGLEGKDLFPNTILALQVELAEFANEGRWFKHWSKNQNPRLEVQCHACNGLGEFHHQIFSGNEHIDDKVDICTYCSGTGIQERPLLGEFVDGVHFFLSLANQKGWQDALYIYEEQMDPDEFDGDLTAWYLEMTYFINKSYFENPGKEEDEKFKSMFGFPQKQYWFRMGWILFLNIGINGFGFTPEQIEEAYFAKNAVNHQRQDDGY